VSTRDETEKDAQRAVIDERELKAKERFKKANQGRGLTQDKSVARLKADSDEAMGEE
jgi:hypothetical protein